jgi:hypothetical protein
MELADNDVVHTLSALRLLDECATDCDTLVAHAETMTATVREALGRALADFGLFLAVYKDPVQEMQMLDLLARTCRDLKAVQAEP